MEKGSGVCGECYNMYCYRFVCKIMCNMNRNKTKKLQCRVKWCVCHICDLR